MPVISVMCFLRQISEEKRASAEAGGSFKERSGMCTTRIFIIVPAAWWEIGIERQVVKDCFRDLVR